MLSIFTVFLGGGIGSAIRYQLSKAPSFTSSHLSFLAHSNHGTFIANLLGSFLLGIIFALHHKDKISSQYFLLLGAGLCGGLTTFSTFAVELVNLGKERQLVDMLIYLSSSLILGCILAYFAYQVTFKFIR